ARNPWTLTFQNGNNTATVQTPSVPASVQPLPFVNNVTISGSGLAPTVSWTNTAANIDAVAVRIRDNGVSASIGSSPFHADLIHLAYFTPSTMSYQLPSLLAGHTYSIEIDQVQMRSPFNPNATAGANFVNTLNQSRAFFNFSASTSGFAQSSV